MRSEMQDIVALLERTFKKGAWHGPAVMEVLAGLSDEEALHRLPNTHSIIELVGHMTAWRRYLVKKLSGDLTYTVTDDMNFPPGEGWNQALEQLIESQRQLVAALNALPAEKLGEQVPWTEQSFTYYSIIHGIIHHDLYHTGQIILIRKATPQQPM